MTRKTRFRYAQAPSRRARKARRDDDRAFLADSVGLADELSELIARQFVAADERGVRFLLTAGMPRE